MADEEIVEDEIEDEQPEGVEDEPKDGDDPYKDLSHEDAIERLRKAEKTIVKNKRTQPPKQTTSKSNGADMPDWAQDLKQKTERAEFAEDHGLTRAQTEAVFRFNGGTAPDEETLQRPEVQAMIKALGSKDRVAANTPKGRNAPVHKGKTFSEIATGADSSKEDKHAAFEGVRKKHGIA
jgi:hypothetical protein